MDKVCCVNVDWIFNHGFINNYAVAEGPRQSILKIRSVRPVHSGQYTCMGSKFSKKTFKIVAIPADFIATAILKVFGMQCTNVEVFSLTCMCVSS